jgi:hypothetical protein
MQQVSSERYENKENIKKDKKLTALKRFNVLLSKIGKVLNTSQLSNYK